MFSQSDIEQQLINGNEWLLKIQQEYNINDYNEEEDNKNIFILQGLYYLELELEELKKLQNYLYINQCQHIQQMKFLKHQIKIFIIILILKIQFIMQMLMIKLYFINGQNIF